MPIIKQKDYVDTGGQLSSQRPTQQYQDNPDGPNGPEILGAAFRSFNTLGAAVTGIYDMVENDLEEISVGKSDRELLDAKGAYFNPIEHIPEGYDGYEEFFIPAENDIDIKTIKKKIDRENADRKTLNEGGAFGTFATIGSVVMDPINLLPVTNSARIVKTGSMLKGGALVARDITLANSASEMVLQRTQLQRDWQDGAVDLTAGAFLGQILGAGAYKYLSKNYSGLVGETEKLLTVPATATDDMAPLYKSDPEPAMESPLVASGGKMGFGQDTAGAAKVNPVTLEDYGVNDILLNLDKPLARDPASRLLHSPSIASRQIINDLEIISQQTGQNVKGIKSSIPTRILADEMKVSWANTKQAMYDELDSYRVENGARGGRLTRDVVGDARGVGQAVFQKIKPKAYAKDLTNEDEFMKMVQKTYEDQIPSGIPQVDKAAKAYGEYYKDVETKLKKVGLLTEGKTIENYFPVIWDRKAVRANRNQLQSQLVDMYRQQDIKATRELEVIPKDIERNNKELSKLKKAKEKDKAAIDALEQELERLKAREKDLRKRTLDRTDTELFRAADKTIDNMIGKGHYNNLTEDGVKAVYGPTDKLNPQRARFKERVLDMPFAESRPYRVNNALAVGERLANEIAPVYGFKAKYGNNTMSDLIKAINSDYSILQERIIKQGVDKNGKAIPVEKRNKAVDALKKQMERDIRDVEAIVDQQMGTWGLATNKQQEYFYRALSFGKASSNLALMGSATLGSIADAGKMVMEYGFSKSLGKPFQRMINQASREASKLSRKEIAKLTAISESANDTRALSMADLLDNPYYDDMSVVERGVQFASQRMTLVNVMGYWNAFWRRQAGFIALDDTFAKVLDISKGKKMDEKTMAALAENYIDKPMAMRMAKQIEKHGDNSSGIWLTNFEKWTDQEAVQTLRASMIRQMQQVIVEPGAFKPLWLSTPLGSFLGQFMGFFFGSMQRTTMTALQRKDMQTLQGLIAMVSLGSASYALAATARGEKLSDDPKKWIAEGIDRSGMLGWMLEPNNRLETLTSNKFGIRPMLGISQASRYSNRDVWDVVLGPSGGQGKRAGDLVTAMLTGDWDEHDTRNMRRLLPFQNVFYTRWLFDEFEDGVNGALGIETEDE